MLDGTADDPVIRAVALAEEPPADAEIPDAVVNDPVAVALPVALIPLVRLT